MEHPAGTGKVNADYSVHIFASRPADDCSDVPCVNFHLIPVSSHHEISCWFGQFLSTTGIPTPVQYFFCQKSFGYSSLL
jgi:hypothetical protein